MGHVRRADPTVENEPLLARRITRASVYWLFGPRRSADLPNVRGTMARTAVHCGPAAMALRVRLRT
jgi:hypothetical protein